MDIVKIVCQNKSREEIISDLKKNFSDKEIDKIEKIFLRAGIFFLLKNNKEFRVNRDRFGNLKLPLKSKELQNIFINFFNREKNEN